MKAICEICEEKYAVYGVYHIAMYVCEDCAESKWGCDLELPHCYACNTPFSDGDFCMELSENEQYCEKCFNYKFKIED